MSAKSALRWLLLTFITLQLNTVAAQAPYVVPDYTPKTVVVAMHNVPRITGESDFNVYSETYMNGLVFIAIPFFFIGLASLVAFPLSVFIRNACPVRLPHKKTFTRQEVAIKFDKSRCIFVTTWAIVAFGTFLLFLGNGQTHAGHVSGLEAIADQAEVFESSVVDMISAYNITEEAYSELEFVRDECQVVEVDYLINVTNCLTGIEEWQEAQESGGANLLQMIEVFDIDDRHALINWMGTWVLTMFCASLLGLLFIGSCYKFGMPVIKFGLFLGWAGVPATIVSLIALWIMCGIAMALTVGTCDFCMDPSAAILMIGSERNDTSMAFTEYYLTCEGEGLDTLCMYPESQCTHALNEARSDIEAVEVGCSSEASASMEAVIVDLEQAVDFLSSVEEALSCENVNGEFVEFRTSTCDVMAPGMTILWSGFLVICVLLLGSLSSAPDGNMRKQEAMRMVQM